ncbi:MAG: hypothetical protein KDE53_06610, partial [Caldilineaceae bacterium]|nr:hypothetical protein [Caldilineaceae bacterium]
AVLAANNRGIDNGVNRLLENDFSGCVVGDLLTFCALEGSGGEGSGGSSSTTSSDSGAGNSDSTGSDSDGTPTDPEKPTPPRGTDAPLLLIDDNRAASADELSEADSYLQHLVAAGYQVDLWSVTDQGVPAVDDLTAYGWVIWSNGGYAAGAIGGRDLDTIFSYINANGRITISSRAPLPGLEEMAPISDIVVDSAIPALVADLPEAPIALVDAGSAAVLNAMAEEDDATQVVMRRGPASENADAPALVVLADPSSAESEARLMIVALSMTWLPDEEQTALIDNMATWMLTP